MISTTIDAPRPIAAVTMPERMRRKRFSSGDSRNFSKCGNTASATRSRSFAELIWRILSATAMPMCLRAEIADCVTASGFSSELRTMRRSVPQARQNWLFCLSSDPQDGQYISRHYTATSQNGFLLILSFLCFFVAKTTRVKIRSLLPEVSYEKSNHPDPDPRFVLSFGVAAVCPGPTSPRSEEHTSELQSRLHLVCRLLL